MLLSGGLDSFTAAAMTKADGYELYALSVRYGQVHAREIARPAPWRARSACRRHLELAVDLAAFGGSALVGDGAIPKDRALDAIAASRRPTCPRATRCFSRSRSRGPKSSAATAIVIGVNALDYSGYPDCRPEYLEAFERLAALATKAGVEGRPLTVLAPLLRLSKADIIRRGLALGLDYGLTHSCYDPAPSARRAAGATAAPCEPRGSKRRVCRIRILRAAPRS